MAKIIVFGNQKGGSGKSTSAIHCIVGLLRQGYKVAAIDLDSKQGTLSRHIENRETYAVSHPQVDLPIPVCHLIDESTLTDRIQAAHEEAGHVAQAIEVLKDSHDIIVIDTPGTDNNLSRVGHTYADILVTPINDSLIDLDLLAKIDPETYEVKGPSVYSEMVWQQRQQRMLQKRGTTEWIVMRNRLGHTHAKNKQIVSELLEKLSERIRFRLAPGFGERVIFRELFLKGLTKLDLKEVGEYNLSMSHIAARQEVRSLLKALNLDREADDHSHIVDTSSVGDEEHELA